MITVDMIDWERLAEDFKCEFVAFAWSIGNKETFEEMRKDFAELHDMLRNIDFILFEFMLKNQKFDYTLFSEHCKNYLVNENALNK